MFEFQSRVEREHLGLVLNICDRDHDGWGEVLMAQGGYESMRIAAEAARPIRPGGLATWLTDAERTWIHERLSADKAALGIGTDHGLARALLDPRVWQLGICNLLILGSSYAFILSVPVVLHGATQWSATARITRGARGHCEGLLAPDAVRIKAR
jgi:hypothetical protein